MSISVKPTTLLQKCWAFMLISEDIGEISIDPEDYFEGWKRVNDFEEEYSLVCRPKSQLTLLLPAPLEEIVVNPLKQSIPWKVTSGLFIHLTIK